MAADITFVSITKRPRLDDVSPAAPASASASEPSPRLKCPFITSNPVLDYLFTEAIFSFSALPTLARLSPVCRRFRMVIDRRPAMQRLCCNLLGIRPCPDKRFNQGRVKSIVLSIQKSVGLYETFMQIYDADPDPGLRSQHMLTESAWKIIRQNTRPASPIRYFLVAAKAMQIALVDPSLSPLNPSLKRIVSQSLPKYAMLPFLLLSGAVGTTRELLDTFPLSSLALWIALDQSDTATCNALAGAYRKSPNPLQLRHLLTDALSGRGATPEKIRIFYNIGARPTPRSLECLLRSYDPRVNPMHPDWSPESYRLLDYLLSLDAPVTENVLEIILQHLPPSLFSLPSLENLLVRFKKESKEHQLSSTFLDVVTRNEFYRSTIDASFHERIELLLRLGCRPSTDTLIAFRQCQIRARSNPNPAACAEISRMEGFLFYQFDKNDFCLKCLLNPEFIGLLSKDDMRGVLIKPTPMMVEAFYKSLAALNDVHFDICVVITDWLAINGHFPSAESIFTILKMGILVREQAHPPLDFVARSHRMYEHLRKLTELYSLDKDTHLIPDRRHMLLLYFIHMSSSCINRTDLCVMMQGGTWLEKSGLKLRFETQIACEKRLLEFIHLFSAAERIILVPFVLRILDRQDVPEYQPTPATLEIFAAIPDYFIQPGVSEFLTRTFPHLQPPVLFPAAPAYVTTGAPTIQ